MGWDEAGGNEAVGKEREGMTSMRKPWGRACLEAPEGPFREAIIY